MLHDANTQIEDEELHIGNPLRRPPPGWDLRTSNNSVIIIIIIIFLLYYVLNILYFVYNNRMNKNITHTILYVLTPIILTDITNIFFIIEL